MSITFVTASPTQGTTYTLANYDDDLMIAPGVVIASNPSISGAVIAGTDSDNNVFLAGTVMTSGTAVRLGNDAVEDYNSSLTITATGQIIAQDTGVYMRISSAVLTNSGLISSYGQGVEIHSNAAGSITIENSGRIEAGTTAIVSSGLYGTNALTVHNTGVIISTFSGSIASYGVTNVVNWGSLYGGIDTGLFEDKIVNRGLIDGYVYLGLGADTLDNRGGVLEGVVSLGGGADTLDNRGGQITGDIFGDAGDDLFKPGAGIETIDGGADSDTLDFRGGPAVVVALDGSLTQTGFAADDTYTNIEHIIGSNFSDVLAGSALANRLIGAQGADVLVGNAGADVLRGGLGVDTLVGGAGNDIFLFALLSEAGDVITDFGNVGGNNDVIRFVASALGGGLVAGAVSASVFVTRAADTLAQDADDRFIFQTSDKTLWFDVDGTGIEAAVLLVDLQDTAVFGAGDMLLI